MRIWNCRVDNSLFRNSKLPHNTNQGTLLTRESPVVFAGDEGASEYLSRSMKHVPFRVFLYDQHLSSRLLGCAIDMRIRFSLRRLLILPVLLALCIAWVTWPTRTFESFCSSIRDGNFAQVNSMVKCVDCSFEYKSTPDYPTGGICMEKSGRLSFSCISQSFLELGYVQERSLADILMARSSFLLPRRDPGPQFEFVIERTQITMYYCGP